MAVFNLKRTEDTKNLILLLEVGVYLHDIGKLSMYFIASKAKNNSTKDLHGQILFMDDYDRKLPDTLFNFLSTPIYKILNLPPIFNGLELDFSLSQIVCAHHGCSRCFLKNPCPLKDKIEKYKLIALLKTVDHMDASNPLDVGKQGEKNVFIDRFFNKPLKIRVDSLDSSRYQVYQKLDRALFDWMKSDGTLDSQKFRKAVFEVTKVPFTHALSETRLYGNDITLFDHSFATATLFKAYLSCFLNFGIPFPRTFSEVNYAFIKGENVDKHLIEEGLALSNVTFTYKGSDFIPYPNLGKKKIKETIKDAIGTFEIVKDPYDCFPEYKNYLLSLRVKNVTDIKENYTWDRAIADVKKVIYFAILKEREKLLKKLKSSVKHLVNISKGIGKNRANGVKFMEKLNEIEHIMAHLESKPKTAEIKTYLNVENSKEIEPDIEEYFDLITSPIRPPSPTNMSRMFLKYYRKTHSYKKVLLHFVILRPLTLGRLIAFGRAVNAGKEDSAHA